MLLLRWPGLFHMESGKWRMKLLFLCFYRWNMHHGKVVQLYFWSHIHFMTITTFLTASELEPIRHSLIQSIIFYLSFRRKICWHFIVYSLIAQIMWVYVWPLAVGWLGLDHVASTSQTWLLFRLEGLFTLCVNRSHIWGKTSVQKWLPRCIATSTKQAFTELEGQWSRGLSH